MRFFARRCPMKVLLVDDSLVIRRHLVEMLSEVDGVNVVGEAGDIGEALYLVQYKNPDLAIIDLGLPQGSGLELLRRIKLYDSAITVIVLTNYAQDFNREACNSAGADFFFDKSLEFEQVPPLLGLLAAGRPPAHWPPHTATPGTL